MNICDKIYVYDPNDVEYQAAVCEVLIRTKVPDYTRMRPKDVYQRIEATIVKRPRGSGVDGRIVIENDAIQTSGWDWSHQPIPPIRKGAIVEIDNWDRLVRCRVHGYVEGLGNWRGHDFVLEGISAKRDPNDVLRNEKLESIKGYRFRAPASIVKRVIKEGQGTRLMRLPFMPDDEYRAFFKDLFK